MKAHPCIGGPLDGEFATDGDFHGYHEKMPGTQRNDYTKPIEGMYEHLRHEYVPYNISTRSHMRGKKGRANVVYVHDSINKFSIAARKR